MRKLRKKIRVKVVNGSSDAKEANPGDSKKKKPKRRLKRTLKSKTQQKSTKGHDGKRKLKKRYKKQRCAYIKEDGSRCKKNAVGKSTLCTFHGANRTVKEDLIPYNEFPLATKFDPSVHPISYIEYSRHGLSDVEIAAQFEIGLETLRGWMDTFVEMNTAYEIGQAMYEAYFLEQGRNNLSNTRFNTSLFKFLTGNKLGYTEKIESKNFNQNINHGVLLVPDSMSVDDWEAQNIKEDKAKKEAIDAEYQEVETDKD